MIIDSHAHYAHKLYTGEFDYLGNDADGFCLRRGDRQALLEDMQAEGIKVVIEPSTGLDRIEEQLSLAKTWSGRVHLAFGVHPKQCIDTLWEERERLEAYVQSYSVVAIGETGLDYSMKDRDCEPACQKQWFDYQIDLAHEQSLPLILHIREAERDALEILRLHRDRLHGGVAHCFYGAYETAKAYMDLGLALGVGGKIWDKGLEGEQLRETVRQIPLSAILVETDAPYIRPEITHLADSRKQRQKVRNSSLILPRVIETIANLRSLPLDLVENTIYQNTVRVFRLHEGDQ